MTEREQLFTAAAFLIGALVGGAYVYIYQPSHSHVPLEERSTDRARE